MNASAKARVPVFFLELRTKNSGTGIMPPLDQFKKKMLFSFGGIVEQPLIKNQKFVVRELLEQFG